MDNGGLLGDLPRSRPGNRSPKRGARRPAARREAEKPIGPEPAPAGDLAADAMRAAVGVAEAGLKVASRITGEVIRRLPRV